MELIILNKNFEATDALDVFESIIWTDRYSSYGDFEGTFSSDEILSGKIKQDYYIISDESEHAMIIDDISLDTDVELGNHLIATGKSLESILSRRIIWSQTILNGSLQDGIEKLLNENVISPSIKERTIENFFFLKSEDEAITSLKVQAQFTGDNLYDAIKELCDNVDIGFKITFNELNQFIFQLYAGVDRSYDQEKNPYVVFSPSFENIINSNYFNSKSLYKSVALVAGEGEGSARRTVVVGKVDGTGLERRELFVDARDISSTVEDGTLSTTQYNAQLRQRGEEHLAEYKITKAFEGEVETTQMYRYGEHFNMGDLVQLENEYGLESKVRVTEFIWSQDQQGVENYPTFTIIEDNEETEES